METVRKTLKAATWKCFFFWGGGSQKPPNRTPLYTEVGFKRILKPSRAMNGILRSFITVYVIDKPKTEHRYVTTPNRGHITATPAQFKNRGGFVSQARLIPWTLRGHQPRTVLPTRQTPSVYSGVL